MRQVLLFPNFIEEGNGLESVHIRDVKQRGGLPAEMRLAAKHTLVSSPLSLGPPVTGTPTSCGWISFLEFMKVEGQLAGGGGVVRDRYVRGGQGVTERD